MSILKESRAKGTLTIECDCKRKHKIYKDEDNELQLETTEPTGEKENGTLQQGKETTDATATATAGKGTDESSRQDSKKSKSVFDIFD
jgi:hypothetical protein